MKDLIAMFVEAGCENVTTYIQSGNVIFTATSALCKKLPDLITAQIAKRFGYRTPLVLRSADELADVIRSNPFVKPGAPEDNLHVLFLAGQPTTTCVETLDSHRSPPDSFAVCGREVYLQLPNGVAKSKLNNAYFDSKLVTMSTGRNWRTVNQLLELMKV